MKNFAVAILILLTLTLSAQTASDIEITADPTYHLILENRYARVFKVGIAPHAATLMHRHRHDYISVALNSTAFSVQVEGKAAAVVKMQAGEPVFVEGNFAHLMRSLSAAPYRSLTVELMQNAQAHKSSSSKWDEERGLHILEGGVRDVMFVRDGVRVSQIELQPGGMLPKLHHPGPYLIIALTGLDLKSETVGRGASQLQLAAGDVQWMRGSVPDSLMNVGEQQAKFITLEFP
jgi:quercetin dioxygenase-like cupin family protein